MSILNATDAAVAAAAAAAVRYLSRNITARLTITPTSSAALTMDTICTEKTLYSYYANSVLSENLPVQKSYPYINIPWTYSLVTLY